jgi:hypothetical protein
VPDTDPDGLEIPLPKPISIPQALDTVSTLRTFTEQQKEDHAIFNSGPRHNIDMYDGDGAMRDSSSWDITYCSTFFHC